VASRLDQLLVERGLFPSREQARRAVMAGLIRVDGRRMDKPGTAVGAAAALEVAEREPFVSRAGRKLAAALDHYGLDPAGWVCLDVGASTGGFTHCLLERGARRVYALDVGHGQLDQRLRHDPRVVVMERVNARHLAAGALPEPCDLITVDVSFISLLKVAPALLPHLRRPAAAGPTAGGASGAGGYLLVLIKPQFEAGRGAVGKGGILRDEALRRRVIEECAGRLAGIGAIGTIGATGAAGESREAGELEAAAIGDHGATAPAAALELAGACFDSPVAGSGGNREAFALLRRRAR
jgi:23S rRNA (cytidine1920-2'-O)/16S rRNA (cytidine1409-2'-O)-methyltransferase